MSVLRLIYRPEDEWHGELSARVDSDGFGGHGAAWFGIDELRAFCGRLGGFPIDEGGAPSLAGGVLDDKGHELAHCHLGIWLSPYDARGSIQVTVTLATPASEGEGADLTVRFLVGYEDVARFGASLMAMLDGHAEEAVLAN